MSTASLPAARRLLLVNGDPDLSRLQQMVLERDGHDVDRVAGATQAVALLKLNPRPFDAVLVEWYRREFDGPLYEAAVGDALAAGALHMACWHNRYGVLAPDAPRLLDHLAARPATAPRPAVIVTTNYADLMLEHHNAPTRRALADRLGVRAIVPAAPLDELRFRLDSLHAPSPRRLAA